MKGTSYTLKIISAAIFCMISISGFGQKSVAVDNWFNHETNAKTGKIYHYTWDDTDDSGFSQLGEIFKSKGAALKTIAGKPDKKNLEKVDVYIIVDADTTTENPHPNYIESDDIKAVTNWVRDGGTLLILANDGPNCEFTHLNNLAKVFGMHFNHVTLNHVTGTNWEMGAETKLPNHPVFKGVKKIYLKDVSSLTLRNNAKPVLIDNQNVYMAEVKFGKGFVFAVTDPWIYNEYIDHKYLPQDFDNLKATDNLCGYLLQKH